jgi:hypothetical protein
VRRVAQATGAEICGESLFQHRHAASAESVLELRATVFSILSADEFAQNVGGGFISFALLPDPLHFIAHDLPLFRIPGLSGPVQLRSESRKFSGKLSVPVNDAIHKTQVFRRR